MWVQGIVANADDNFANCVTHDERRETCFEATDTRTLRELLDGSVVGRTQNEVSMERARRAPAL